MRQMFILQQNALAFYYSLVKSVAVNISKSIDQDISIGVLRRI